MAAAPRQVGMRNQPLIKVLSAAAAAGARPDLGAMNIERIAEPIRVLAVFSAGAIEPLRFRWGRRTYKIDRINGRWTDRGGNPSTGPETGPSTEFVAGGYALNYSVQVGKETYYIHFSSAEVQWWLDQVVID